MNKEKFLQLIKPTLEKQTLYQCSQMKSFVDSSLKEVASKEFSNDQEKIKYLIETLHSIRDFTLALTTENSLRQNLITQFQKLEQEAEAGNVLQEQKESRSKTLDELLASDPSN